jgi:hypothetical protein
MLGNVPLRRDAIGEVDVMVRAEEVLVDPGDRATVTDVVFYGHDALYVVKVDDGPVICSRVLATPSFRPGDRVQLRYSGRPTVAFPPIV